MTLRTKTISGFKWSFIDTVVKYFLSFIIGVILARLLSPSDYGLVGISTIFIAISRVFVDGGFSDALIRKTTCKEDDYSTVFIFNLTLAIVFYFVLFGASAYISKFFEEPLLVKIIRVAGLSLIIGSTASVQSVILKKNLNFKKQAIISFVSTIVSGTISIYMAFKGYGVWSLVFSVIFQGISSSLLLWLTTKWKLKFSFKINIFKEHFSFGSKIMISSFIYTLYNNIYYAVIGKIFSHITLGYYSKADNFQKMFSENIDTVVRQVTYPVLSSIQENIEALKASYRVLLRFTFFINFILLMGLASIAKPLILILIGNKWLPSVPYLQLLCFVGILFPITSININILNVKGRSDLSLKASIIRILFTIPVLLIGYFGGIYAMIFGMFLASFIFYYIVVHYSNLVLKYSLREQIIDFLPSIKLAVFSLFPIFILGQILTIPYILILSIQIISGVILLISFGEIFKNSEYLYIRNYIKSMYVNFNYKKRWTNY